MIENANQVQAQIIRGLRYFIVLRILKIQPMHGYEIVTVIRNNFGICLGPSSVYPLLNDLESRKYLDNIWETESLHLKRIYKLTSQGQNMLNRMERSFGPIMTGTGMTGITQQTVKE